MTTDRDRGAPRPQLLKFAALAWAAIGCMTSLPAMAEAKQVTLAQEYGVSYLPLMVMKHDHLIQKNAEKLGLGKIRVHWATFTGGADMNAAILSGRLDFASGGVAPLIKIWNATKGNLDVRGVAAINSMPLYLNTTNPKVKTIRDFTNKDRIALPAVKVSIQAVTLQMAAAKAFGFRHYSRLDHLTVSMKHPDAMVAMLSHGSGIDAHFGSPPFQEQELEHPGVHRVLDSYDVLGGPATFNAVWTTGRFRRQNPKLYEAVLDSLKQAMKIINGNKMAAAKLYIKASHSKLPVSFVYKIMTSPEVKYTVVPLNTMKYASFMYRTHQIRHDPSSWKDLFFPNIYGLPGS
ncbi:MAG: ABC transporter substrate-binding protein [Acidiferrobacteraceae bacterium]